MCGQWKGPSVWVRERERKKLVAGSLIWRKDKTFINIMPEVQNYKKKHIRQHLEELSIDTNDNKLKKVFFLIFFHFLQIIF